MKHHLTQKRVFISLGLFILALNTDTSQAQNFSNYSVEALSSSSYDARADSTDSIITLKHSSSWAKGDNFIFADISSPDNFSNHGSVYTEWAPRISLGKVTTGKPFQKGPIKDIFLMAEVNHLHTHTGTNTTTLFGLSMDLALPGFNFFKVHLENRDDPSLAGNSKQLSLIWNYPFTISKYHFSFEGFLDYAGNEGSRNSNLLTQPQLVWKFAENFNIGLEYQYWRNKFGIKGLNESAMQALVRWTF